MDRLLPGLSEASRRLDVTILHTLVLERLLGIDKENMANQRNLTYTRDAAEAAASVEKGKAAPASSSIPPGWRRSARWRRQGRRCPRNPPIFTPSSSPAW